MTASLRLSPGPAGTACEGLTSALPSGAALPGPLLSPLPRSFSCAQVTFQAGYLYGMGNPHALITLHPHPPLLSCPWALLRSCKCTELGLTPTQTLMRGHPAPAGGPITSWERPC